MTLLQSTRSCFLLCSIFLLFANLPWTSGFASIVVPTISSPHSNKLLLLGNNRANNVSRRPSVVVLKSERLDANDFFYGQQQQQHHQARRVAPIYEKKADKRTQKTLYDILGASPTASKAELKKLYIALAKQTHPDAQISGTSSTRDDLPEFTEVAKAWGILSDSHKRQKYDRDLAGEAFADQIIEAGELVIRLAIILGQETLQALDRFRAENTAT